MHEHSIVRALLDTVRRHAESHRAIAVTRLTVRIGELSGVEPDLLVAAFEVFRDGTPCAGASLEIVPSPAAWVCPSCRAPVPAGAALRCAPCGVAARLEGGDEILLERIEMEVV